MLKFSRLEPEKVYRVKDKFTLPIIGEKIIGKDNLLAIFGESMNDTINFFTRPFIRFRGYKKYYIDRIVKFNLMGRQVYFINDQKEIYMNGFGSKYPEIALARNPGVTSNHNTIYEIGQYMSIIGSEERINRKAIEVRSTVKFDMLLNKLKLISSEFPLHKKKYLYLPLDNYIANPKNTIMWTKKADLDNPLVAFLRLLENNWSRIKNELPEWTFVFLNINELFYINCKDMNQETFGTIRKLFKKFRSKRGSIITESSDPHLEVEEGEADTVDDDKSITILNNKTTNKVINDVDEILKDVKLSKKDINDIKSKAVDSIIDKKEVISKSPIKSTVKKSEPKSSIKKTVNTTSTVKTTVIKSSDKAKEDKPKEIDTIDNKPITKVSKVVEKKKEDKKKTISSLTTKSITKPVVDVVVKDNKSVKDEIHDLKVTTNKIIEQEPDKKDETLVHEQELQKTSEKVIKKEILDRISPTMSPQRLARVKKIQSDMENITINNKTIKQIKEEANSELIEPCEIKADVINENIKDIKFNNFEKGYNKKLMEPDLVNILTKFSEMDRPLYLISLDKEDTSTTMDKKYTYTAVYEDEKGRRHTVKFDYPKFVNNKFIHINNSDKLFINQVIPLPVTKVSPDEVQLSSNYKKVFIKRFGKNVSSKSIKFSKVISDIDSRILGVEYGNNLKANTPYMTTMEYDDLSQKYSKFILKNHNITIYFNQKEIRDICDENNLPYTDENIPFAILSKDTNSKEVILLDSSKDKIVGSNLTPVDFINAYLNKDIPNFLTQFRKTSSGKRLMYTRATIMKKKVPIVLLLSFLIGLEPLLNKLKIDYQFTDKRIRNDDINKVVLEFKDGYLIYDGSKFSNALIMNGLIDIPTKEYDFLQFSGKDIYFDLFSKLYGRRNIGNAFENFNQEFVDPITEEILEHCKLPTNFIDLIIYGNSLLENNTCDFDGDMTNFRIRSNELVNVHLYQILTKAYESYRNTADNKNPQKFSVKQNELINNIFDSQILEEYSTLNPIFEIDRMRATSYKGPGGCNIDRAFSVEKRAYNDSMLGVFAQSSPVSANIGVSRVLSLNPNVKSLRGYIEPGSTNEVESLNQTNMLSGAELLVPLTPTHDDPQRVAMASTQSRHTISTVDSDVPLFGYGFDKVLAKTISDRFAFKAKGDGIISEVNEKLGYMIIKYDDETEPEVVDLTNRQALNTGSGFYINNKLSANLKEGDRVSEGDVVAANKDFFEYNELTGDTVYKSGPMARVAVIHGSSVFEDSTIMTESFAEKMSSYVTEKKDMVLGKNSNIYSIAKIGDEIKVNEPLLVFDESYQDDYLNKILEKMSETEKNDIVESGRTKITSKWNGKLIDIKIYYTVPKEELSESLQQVINSYEKDIKKRMKTFKNNGINIKDMVSLNDQATYTEPVNGKIEGIKMGDKQVLIKFFIQTLDKFSGGDKCTYSTALKGINQTLIPKGKEPYLASDPSVKVDAFMSMSGYYSRMTNSFPITMALNATLMGAEKKIKDMLK